MSIDVITRNKCHARLGDYAEIILNKFIQRLCSVVFLRWILEVLESNLLPLFVVFSVIWQISTIMN
jgi:hypothetical protein